MSRSAPPARDGRAPRRRTRRRSVAELARAIGQEPPPQPPSSAEAGGAPEPPLASAEEGGRGRGRAAPLASAEERGRGSGTNLEALLRVLWKHALDGDLRAMRLLLEYMEGKPVQVAPATAQSGRRLSADEMRRLLAGAQAKLEAWEREKDEDDRGKT